MMQWKDLASTVAHAAPVIASLLPGPAGPVAGSILASVFGSDNDPDAVAAAIKADPAAAQKMRAAELDHVKDMRALAIKARAHELDAQTTQQTNINETIRAEMQANGLFKSGWRAFIGWVLGLAFAEMATALSVAAVLDPSQMSSAAGAMMVIVPAMAAVLGVNIAGNRRERETAMTGHQSTSLLDAVAHRVKNGANGD